MSSEGALGPPAAVELPRRPALRPTSRLARRITRRPGAVVAAAILALMVVVALTAPWWWPTDPDAQNLLLRSGGPSKQHVLGTDAYGRDLLSRLIFGARASLGTAVIVVAAGLAIAMPVGLLSGFKGGALDKVTMRLVDAGLSVPPVVLAVAMAGAMGPGQLNLMIALTTVYVPSMIRLVRAQAVSQRVEPFIDASRLAGTSTVGILVHRLLPNVLPPVLIACPFWLGGALLAEASLSYLGLGVQPPTSSWGSMLKLAYETSLFTSPYQLVVPSACIAVTILQFHLLGEGLRDVLGAQALTRPARSERRGLTTVRRVVPRSTEAVSISPTRTLLVVDGLSVSMRTDTGEHLVVDDVSFSIGEQEIVGLVGESGCGKSVTSLAITRLLPSPPARIVAGEVVFKGEDLLGLSRRQMLNVRGSGIGMVFQDPMSSLNPTLTIGRQLVEAQRVHDTVDRRAAERRAVELLDLVQIPAARQRLGDHPHQLSGGMRQRVMIALALASRPSLLIADEPTTALDVTVQARILDLLRELQREFAMSVLFVTHDLGVVAQLCDRAMVMYAGQIVEQGTVVELFERPQHPYTAGLLKATPRLDGAERTLHAIPGRVPSPSEFATGCRFASRCEHVESACRSQPQLLLPSAEQRLVRCSRSQELTMVGVDAGV